MKISLIITSISVFFFAFALPVVANTFWTGVEKFGANSQHIMGITQKRTEHGGSVRLNIITNPKFHCIPTLYYREEHTNIQPHDGIEVTNLRFRVDDGPTYVFENREIRRKVRGDEKIRQYSDWVMAPRGADAGLAVMKEMMAGRKVYAQMSHDGSWDSKTFSWGLTRFKRSLENQIDVCRRESSKIGSEAEPDDPWS